MRKINNYFLQSKKISSIDDYIVEKLKLNKDTKSETMNPDSMAKHIVDIIGLKGYGTINKKIENWCNQTKNVSSLLIYTTEKYLSDVNMHPINRKLISVISSSELDNMINKIYDEVNLNIAFNNGDTRIYTSKESLMYQDNAASDDYIIFTVEH